MPRIRIRTKTTCGWSTVWSMVRAARGRRAAAAAWGGQAPMYIHLVKSAECVSRRPTRQHTKTRHKNQLQNQIVPGHDSPRGPRHNWRRESQPQQQLGGGRGEDSSPSNIVRGLFVAQPPSLQIFTMIFTPARSGTAVSHITWRAVDSGRLVQRLLVSLPPVS